MIVFVVMKTPVLLHKADQHNSKASFYSVLREKRALTFVSSMIVAIGSSTEPGLKPE